MIKNSINVQVLNEEQVIKAVERARRMTNDNMLDTLTLIGELGVKDAKEFVAYRTGRLKGSLTYTINGRQFGYEPSGDGQSGDRIKLNNKDDVVIWGTNVFYAAFIEARNKVGGQYLIKSFLKNQALFRRMIQHAIKGGTK